MIPFHMHGHDDKNIPYRTGKAWEKIYVSRAYRRNLKKRNYLKWPKKMEKQLAIKERCQPNVDIPLAEGSMETILFICP